MAIEDAAEKLRQHLGEPDVFTVRHVDGRIVVDVHFIYRVKEVEALGGRWEGFEVTTGRRSVW